MLLRIDRYEELDERKLMDVYAESNFENTDYFFPDETNKDVAVRKVEEGFCTFLKEEFFSREGNAYWVLEENGIWVSAMRLNLINDGLYYLEALETKPDRRKLGYGTKLLEGVIEELGKAGPFRICDCVSKKNIPSIGVHEKCGFRIVSDKGYDYLQEEADEHDYGFEYSYPGQ